MKETHKEHQNEHPSNQPYDVGYKKPPKANQYKPGESGNPNGRPKRSKNLMTILEEELDKTVIVNEKGQRYTLTKRETVIKRLVNEAANGHQGAMRTLLSLTGTDPELPEESMVTTTDRTIFDNLLKRHGGTR